MSSYKNNQNHNNNINNGNYYNKIISKQLGCNLIEISLVLKVRQGL